MITVEIINKSGTNDDQWSTYKYSILVNTGQIMEGLVNHRRKDGLAKLLELVATTINKNQPQEKNVNERKKKMPEVIMYTDGSSLGFPGPSGWAVVLNTELSSGYGYSRCYTGEIAEAYGLQAELIAVTEGLKLLKGPSKVTIYTDSKYIVRMFQQGWIYGWRKRHWHTVTGKPVANRELIEQMYEAMEPHHVNILWVRGHSGDRFNRLADSLAGFASAKAAESVARINGSTSV